MTSHLIPALAEAIGEATGNRPTDETAQRILDALRKRGLALGIDTGAPLNINALDPDDWRGVYDPIDHDIEDVRRDQMAVEVNSAAGIKIGDNRL